MKILGLSMVVALGLVIGLWWTREAPRPAQESPVRPAQASPVDQSARRAPIGPSNASPRPELAKQERPTLEPTDADPKRRELQEALLRHLRVFATEAELTDAQWDQFVRDLSELAATESAAIAQSVRAGNVGAAFELNGELGHELEERIAAYMTDKQLRVFRFRLHAGDVVARVRQLHFVPTVIPES